MTRHYGIPNPEAPLEGLHDHWEPPPKADGGWSLIVVFLVVVLAGIAVYSCSARADVEHDITLFLAVVTSQGKPDIKYQETMPDVETCFKEADKFVRHRPPKDVDGKRLFAGCSVPLIEENPS